MRLTATVMTLCLALPALAEEVVEEDGVLNPPEMGMDRVMQNIRNGQTDMTTCADRAWGRRCSPMSRGGRAGPVAG